jgi:hypothetical protein
MYTISSGGFRMVNILETVIDAMKSLTVQDEDQPLHVGEVMSTEFT